MSLSPRPLHQSPYAPSFTDYDLTDNYADQRRSSSSSRASSSTNNRHARGDSPLSLYATGRRGGSTSGESSAAGAGARGVGGGGRTGEMPELSRLLAFLDDEEEEEEEEEQHASTSLRESSPPPQPPPSSAPKRVVPPLSSTPPLPAVPPTPRSPAPPPPPQQDSTASTTTTASPSLRAHSRSQLRREGSAAPSSAARVVHHEHAEEEDLPDSPSPLPGSMASLSLGLRRSASALEGEFGAEFGEPGERHSGDEERGADPEQGRDSAHGREARPGDGSQRERESERDDVAELADEVLHEFESIINSSLPASPAQPPHHSPSRPRSRLPRIPSPLSSSGRDGSGGLEHRAASTGSGSLSGDEARRGKRAQGGWRAGGGLASNRSPQPPRHWEQPTASPGAHQPAPPPPHHQADPNANLLAELRDARSYIAKLQAELRSIGQVVGQLKGGGEGIPNYAPAPILPSAPPLRPPLPDLPGTQGSPQSTLAVAQHLLALLPSASVKQVPPPAFDSLALALDFVRDVDTLVHHHKPAKGHAGGVHEEWRRDELVFRRENLESVMRRVRGWERIARGG